MLKLLQRIYNHVIVVAKTYYWLSRFLLRKAMLQNGKKNVDLVDGVTLVITSCNRPVQLRQTINSFLRHNTFPIKQVVFVEDGGSQECISIAHEAFGSEAVYIYNEKNIGQLNSIDKAYENVKTKYIFHLEDDWVFTKSGFIEESICWLESNKSILFVSLRSRNDQNHHPYKYNKKMCTYILKPFWKIVWVGFGFNPSLRKTSDYHLIGSCFGKWNGRETSIGLYYYLHGKRVAVPFDEPYVIHNGWDCSTEKNYNKA